MEDIVCDFCGRNINQDEGFYSYWYEYHEGGDVMRAVGIEKHNICSNCARVIQKEAMIMRITGGC